jgi:hypothetical protein
LLRRAIRQIEKKQKNRFALQSPVANALRIKIPHDATTFFLAEKPVSGEEAV